jgi:hypothetical protein
MKFLILLLGISVAEICDKHRASYSFSDCINNKRSVLFYWKNKDCSNAPPQPFEDVSCDLICDPGTYLTFNINQNKVECSTCPQNTYSTGNTLRFSTYDGNWDEFLQSTTRQCIWVEGNLEIKYRQPMECKTMQIFYFPKKWDITYNEP